MRLASLVISLCLHAAVFLLIWYWPSSPTIRPDTAPMMISLVEGEPGGSRAPSPILGHVGAESEGPLAPAPPAERGDIAAPAREEIKPPARQTEIPVQTPMKPEPVPEKKPEPAKIQEDKAVPVPKKPEPKKPEPKKPEPPKQEKKPEPKKPEPKKPEPKKPEPKKSEPKKPESKPAPKKTAPKQDPIAAALQQARKATSRASSGDKGSAIEQALAQARRNAGGTGGGGGGEGAGPGGGGLGDVYIGQVMLAVRPNWGFASPGRRSLVCTVKVNVDMQGKVLQAVVTKSSGNAQYDASAVNAVIRTSQAGDFPPPPNPGYTDLDLVFTLDEMLRR